MPRRSLIKPELSRLKHSDNRNVPADIIALLLAFSRIMKIRSSLGMAKAFLCLCIDGKTLCEFLRDRKRVIDVVDVFVISPAVPALLC